MLSIILLWLSLGYAKSDIIIAPDGRLGRKFEGIGAISGGGATTKLLPVYDEKYLSEILDYLFKPSFAASLHSLKVEIGGDSQSTEGSEASHMHTPDDMDCTRGYETWLIQRAVKVNPELEIHSLPWTFPGWLGTNPYADSNRTADYVTNWILCIEKSVGIRVWNERAFSSEYIKTLRGKLNSAGLEHVKVIASDNKWEIVPAIENDQALRESIYAIGAHYPGTRSNDRATQLNIPLWSSEDYSTFNNDIGSGCLARILNQNYVNGLMTSTIVWNLIAAYSNSHPFAQCSLMTANEPWSGHYTVNGPVWIAAHTTHFTKPGWFYLAHGSGVGHLPRGGSYVTLISPEKDHLTIIVETMTHDHSKCIRPPLPKYTVEPQQVTFQIIGHSMKNIRKLHVYRTKLHFSKNESSEYFVYLGERQIDNNGQISLDLGLDELYTLSTIKSTKGSHPTPPKSTKFTSNYRDDFQVSRSGIREPEYLTPQVGYFELVPEHGTRDSNKMILQQMALKKPIDWCDVGPNPIALMGYDKRWKNIHVQANVMMPSEHRTKSIFIAARIAKSGCSVRSTPGIFAWLNFENRQYELTEDLAGAKFMASGALDVSYDRWYQLDLVLKDAIGEVYLDNKLLTRVQGLPIQAEGFAGVGCGGFGHARYANFSIDLDAF